MQRLGIGSFRMTPAGEATQQSAPCKLTSLSATQPLRTCCSHGRPRHSPADVHLAVQVQELPLPLQRPQACRQAPCRQALLAAPAWLPRPCCMRCAGVRPSRAWCGPPTQRRPSAQPAGQHTFRPFKMLSSPSKRAGLQQLNAQVAQAAQADRLAERQRGLHHDFRTATQEAPAPGQGAGEHSAFVAVCCMLVCVWWHVHFGPGPGALACLCGKSALLCSACAMPDLSSSCVACP